MKKKLFLLIKYLSRSLKLSRKESAYFLLELFKNNKVFNLSEKHQKLIIENLVTYFQSLVFGIDKLGMNKNLRNKHLSDEDILNHLNNKVRDLVINCRYIKIY